MTYRINVSKDRKFLVVTAKGQINIDIIRKWSEDVEKQSRALGIHKLLFDMRSAENVGSTLENYTFAYQDSRKLNLQKDIRSAILVSAADHSHDFAETTLRNAGYSVRLFTDKSSALNWLEEDHS